MDNSLSTYLSLVQYGAYRWLHAIDLDPTSKTYGIADRDYWAWKTKDFPNATWQGGIAGFLDACPLLTFEDQQIQKIVTACIYGTQSIQRSNGSFEEAYPYESSVCVTGLVVFNLGYAFLKYPGYFKDESRQVLKSVVQKAYDFLIKVPETHGIIANHLATIAYGLTLARKILQIQEDDREVHDVLKLQDPNEFWFPEYGGADPGYQTLLSHYLIAGASLSPIKGLEACLEKSRTFISHFCFPDGSFSGEIGNRGTAIFYPSASLRLTQNQHLPLTNESFWFLDKHIQRLDCSSPITIDCGNFVPLFNSWAFCLGTFQNQYEIEAFTYQPQEMIHLKNAGLIVSKKEKSFMVASLYQATIRKGLQDDSGKWKDASLVGFIKEDYTTQGIQPFKVQLTHDALMWELSAHKRVQKLNGPFYSIILRCAAYGIYRSSFLQKIFKKMLARFVMTYGQEIQTPIRLHIKLESPDHEIIIHNDSGWQRVTSGFHYHMASANTLTLRHL